MTPPANRQRPPAKTAAPRPGSSRARREEERRHRRLRTQLLGAAAVGAVGLVVGVVLIAGGRSTSKAVGLTRPTVLLAPLGASSGQTVDGISCQTTEQVLFHIHAHLAVFVDGQPRGLPAGIGIAEAQVQDTSAGPLAGAGTCFYWLHAHTADGVIHIESPVTRTFTLGDYFDIWGQPLTSGQVGPSRGIVTAYLDGRRVTGSPRAIPLAAHAAIQLDVGTDVAPVPVTFPNGL